MRFLLAMLLLVSVTSAQAEWTLISALSSDVSFYADYETVRQRGETRLVWMLSDYRERDKFGDHSAKALILLDCRDKGYKDIFYAFFSEPMGTGKVRASVGYMDDDWSQPWHDIDRYSLFQIMYARTCVDAPKESLPPSKSSPPNWVFPWS